MVPTFSFKLIPLWIPVIQTAKPLEATASLTRDRYNQRRGRRANCRYYRRWISRPWGFNLWLSRLKNAAENIEIFCFMLLVILIVFWVMSPNRKQLIDNWKIDSVKLWSENRAWVKCLIWNQFLMGKVGVLVVLNNWPAKIALRDDYLTISLFALSVTVEISSL